MSKNIPHKRYSFIFLFLKRLLTTVIEDEKESKVSTTIFSVITRRQALLADKLKEFSSRHERTTCIRQGFWPPLKPKIESYLKTFSLNCFVR